MLLFLIGFMGCGKSTTGRRIASRLGYDFLDLDHHIEQVEGMSIAALFDARGEEAFREAERRELAALGGRTRTVVACGGGTPCFFDNLELMRRLGTTVYLRMTPEWLVGRLHNREKRPMLRGMDDEALLAYIRRVLPERERFYGCADLIIDCEGAGEEYIADHVACYLDHCQNLSRS